MRPFVLFLAVPGVAWAGCGDDERARAPSRSAATLPAAVTETAKDTAPPTAAVGIKGFAYDPTRVTVSAGGEVTWTDRDTANHTVTFSEPGPKDVANVREGGSATVTFAERGSYGYVCEFHPGMAGTVEVR